MKTACWMPGRVLCWLMNKWNGWCTSCMHKNTHRVVLKLIGSGTVQKPHVNQYPTALTGSGLICNEGGCFKAGTITLVQTSVLMSQMKRGWPSATQHKKREGLDHCGWRDWNIFKERQDLRPNIWGSSNGWDLQRRVNDWLNDSIMQMLLKILPHTVKCIHACVGEGEDCEDFNKYLRK